MVDIPVTNESRMPDPSTMPALAFFPWLHLDRNYQIGNCEFLAFDLRHSSDDLTDDEVEAARTTLGAYVDPEGSPVSEATLVRREGAGILAPWKDCEREALFTLREIVTVAGLSRRRFFHWGGYWNADHFQLIVQLNPGTKGVTLVTRRRDGQTMSHWPEGRFQRPGHVHKDIFPVSLDEHLAEALVAVIDDDEGDQFLDAINSFNLANTDSDQILPQTEVVHLVAALQRVLGTGADVKDVIKAIEAQVPMLQRHPPGNAAKFSRPQMSSLVRATVTETWLRDLQRLRGPMAHGHRSPRAPRIWQPHEHLLLGNVAFLAILKTILHNLELYDLTDDDRLEIEVFEHLAAEDLFSGPKDRDPGERPWNAIRETAMNARARRQFATRIRDFLGEQEACEPSA